MKTTHLPLSSRRSICQNHPAKSPARRLLTTTIVCLVSGVVLVLSAPRLFGQPTRTNLLSLIGIGDIHEVGSQDYRTIPNGQRIVNGKIGLTFETTTMNVQPTNGGTYIPWGFPVMENTNNDWIRDNLNFINANPDEYPFSHDKLVLGFTGLSEDVQRPHDFPLPTTYIFTNSCYGPHPHLQFFAFKRIDNGPPILIGCSELKHTFKVGNRLTNSPDYLPSQNFLPPQKKDTYNSYANEDQDFFGPVSELNDELRVPAHVHLGLMNTDHIFERAHGYHAYPGGGTLSDGVTVIPPDPGHNQDFPKHRLEHLLQVPAIELLTDGQSYMGQAGLNPSGRTRWYIAASYFVNGDQVLDDNTRYFEFDPNYDGSSDFRPVPAPTEFDGFWGDGIDFPKFIPPLDNSAAVETAIPSAKWLQRPDASPTGLDVLVTEGTTSQVIADDFLCRNSGPITAIYIWGSWLNDRFDPAATITLGFWSDTPAANTEPSHPADLLWSKPFGPLTANPYTVSLVASNICCEGFFDPSVTNIIGVDTRVYAYYFSVPTNQAFFQTNGNVYWLSVSASNTTNFFGWKSCITNDHHLDDAVFSSTSWVDLHYPPTHLFSSNTMDMAFALLSPEPDRFTNSAAAVTLLLPNGGRETILLSGPTEVHVDVGPHGETYRTNSAGLDQAATEMVQLELSGTSSLGPVNLHLRRPDQAPYQRSTGFITEMTNSRTGILDLPPFATAGLANSYFDVYVEASLPGAPSVILHNDKPKRMSGIITNKPPGIPFDGMNRYDASKPVDLRDEAGNLLALIIYTLHVTVPLIPVKEPVDQTVTNGGTATFTVIAYGLGPNGISLPLNYQWQRSVNGGTWADITGATDASLIVGPVQTSQDASQYRVVITLMSDLFNYNYRVTSSQAGLYVVSGVASVPQFHSVTLDSALVSLNFSAEAKRSYTVQYRESLSEGLWPQSLWLNLASVPAALSSRQVTVSDDLGSNQRYYRLVTPAVDP